LFFFYGFCVLFMTQDNFFFSNRLLVESVFFLSRHQPPPPSTFLFCVENAPTHPTPPSS
jgi:hypothetical protein